MKKRLYVDFHILQTVPPSCINRDDTGSPKTAVYGGVTRARVSSQAWKHAMRAAFAENAQLDVGKRTKKAAELVKAQILALAPELDADKLAKKALENAGIKSDDKGTKALFFMSTAQAKALAELAVEGSADKKQYRDALKAAPSMDMALFGRMVADDPSLNYDAAAQVAHSISTHAVQNEYDYFTAVDDCQAEDNAGAGHLGTVEYNSSTLYRYATVNVMELAGQLGAAAGSGNGAGLWRGVPLLHAHRQAEHLCKPHSAGRGICDPAGGSAGEPVRRIRACRAPQCAGLRRTFQGGTGAVCAADVQQLCRGSGAKLYRGQRAGGAGSGADGKGDAGRTGKGCPGCACRK